MCMEPGRSNNSGSRDADSESAERDGGRRAVFQRHGRCLQMPASGRLDTIPRVNYADVVLKNRRILP
jgi:hypothetical protein